MVIKILIILLLLSTSFSMEARKNKNSAPITTEINLNNNADKKSILKWAKFLRNNCSPYKESKIVITEESIINDMLSFKLNVKCEGDFHVLPRNPALGNVLNNLSLKNTKLNKIEGMENIIEVKNIILENNQNLASIDNWSNVKRISEDFIIKTAGFKSSDFLTNLIKVRKLHIENVPIEDLKGLNRYLNCDEIYLNNVNIENVRRTQLGVVLRRGCKKLTIINTPLKNLNGLEFVRSLEFLDIKDNELTDITGIANLEKVKFIDARNNQIINVNGLRKIKELEYLELSNNKIKNLIGLRNLEMVEKKFNLNNNELKDLRRLSKLKKVGTLDLSNNKIENIKDLNKLEEVEYSIILDRNNLKTLKGLKNLRKIQAIYLRSNPTLRDLSALNNLKEGKLYIDSKEYRIKLDKDSYFCENFKTQVFYGYEESSFENKDSFCEVKEP